MVYYSKVFIWIVISNFSALSFSFKYTLISEILLLKESACNIQLKKQPVMFKTEKVLALLPSWVSSTFTTFINVQNCFYRFHFCQQFLQSFLLMQWTHFFVIKNEILKTFKTVLLWISALCLFSFYIFWYGLNWGGP